MGYRYIGSKARIVDDIIRHLGAPESKDSFFIDAFSGTGVVASKAADFGWKVRVNDIMLNAAVVSEARLISKDDVSFSKLNGYTKAVELLNRSEVDGFIWREYSPASFEFTGIERRYFTERNARKVDGALSLIRKWTIEEAITRKERVLLLATLIYAVNDIANIAGTYGCFLSKWTSQSMDLLKIRCLNLREKQVCYSASTLDVFDVGSKPNDVVYLDPPYTKRQYASYYHILETIVNADEPDVEGVSGLRPWRDKSSVFCYKSKALKALVELIKAQRAKRVLISYSNDGHIQLEDLIAELESSGKVGVHEIGKIGRYRPNQTASSNKSLVKEYLIEYSRNEGIKQHEQTEHI